MLESQNKLKRQIELLGLALNNCAGLKDVDFSELLERDIPTIKRDMQALRGLGIDIHSERTRGVIVDQEVPADVLHELTMFYLWMCNADHGLDRATTLMIKKQRSRCLSNIVALQRAAEQSRIVEIDYQKEGTTIERRRQIGPLRLFPSEGYWRLLAQHDGRIKQFHLNKIVEVHPTERKFKRVPAEAIDAMFRHSFRSWIGTEEYRVKFLFSKKWVEYLKPRQMMATDAIVENEDGSMIVESTVNSLDEVASWVVSRGEGVTVLEPEALKAKVVGLAKGALGNYKIQGKEEIKNKN